MLENWWKNLKSLQAFAKKYRLPFTLLSDEGNKVRKDWGVPSDLFGALPGRQTYVLDKKGVVQLIYNNQFQPEKHIDETLKLLQSLWTFNSMLYCLYLSLPLNLFSWHWSSPIGYLLDPLFTYIYIHKEWSAISY